MQSKPGCEIVSVVVPTIAPGAKPKPVLLVVHKRCDMLNAASTGRSARKQMLYAQQTACSRFSARSDHGAWHDAPERHVHLKNACVRKALCNNERGKKRQKRRQPGIALSCKQLIRSRAAAAKTKPLSSWQPSAL